MSSEQSERRGAASAGGALSVSPSDTADLSMVSRGLYVGVSGDVAVVMEDGQSVLFVGMAAGIVHPLRIRKIKSTGTTATNLVVVY